MKRKIVLCTLVTLLFAGLFVGGFLGYLHLKEGYTPIPDGQAWELGGLFTGEHSGPDPMDSWPVLRDWPCLVLDNGDRVVILMPSFNHGGLSFWNFSPESVGEFVGGGIGDLKPGRWCRLEFELSEYGIRWDSYMMGYGFPRPLDRWGTIQRVEVLEMAPKVERDKAVAIYHQSFPTYRNTSRWTWLKYYCAVAVPVLGLLWAGSVWLILRRKKRGERK